VQSRKSSIFDYTLVNIKTIRTTIQRICGYPRRGQSTIDNAGKQSLSAALCDAHRVKSTLIHCNILPTIKMQSFSCFSCNHRIRAFTSKTSKRRNGNDQYHNCNDPKSDKHAAKNCQKRSSILDLHASKAETRIRDLWMQFHSISVQKPEEHECTEGSEGKSSPEA
jgi:hypothetical protein